MKTFSEAREEIIGALTSTRINKRFVSRDEAERKFDERANRLPTFPSFKSGDEDLVKDDDIIPFLAGLLKPGIWASSKGGEDEDISWGTDRTDPNVDAIPQLVALATQAEADEARARSFGSVFGGAPPLVPGDASFASTNPAFLSAIRPSSAAAMSYATTGGVVLPAVSAGPDTVNVVDVVRGPTGKPVGSVAKEDLSRHAQASVGAAVAKVAKTANQPTTPVAKASARPSHSVRLIRGR